MQSESTGTLQSFDNTEETSAYLLRPDRYRQLLKDLSIPPAISRGAGLTYCMASAAKQGRSILCTQFNRFLGFDEGNKIVRLEPGVTMGDLLAFAAAHSLLPPVMPGYPQITVGGAVAMNVHGKNQFRTGNFADHVTRLTLYHPEKGEIICSSQKNEALFRLTLGGFGLTGHITSVDLALTPLPGLGIIVERHSLRNIFEAVNLMDKCSGDVDYIYSWHNLNLKGPNFGSGFLYTERHQASGPGVSARHILPLTVKPLPIRLFNRFTVPLMCRGYYLKEKIAPRVRKTTFYSAYFPFVGKETYFRLFGKSGFREYQLLLPRDRWDEGCMRIAKAIHHSGAPVTLGSLKLLRGDRRLLNFSGDGICLALDTPSDDAPNSGAARALFADLDEITVEMGGIANISKDSRLNAATVRSMYREQYQVFRDALREHDPNAHFQSELQRRLEL